MTSESLTDSLRAVHLLLTSPGEEALLLTELGRGEVLVPGLVATDAALPAVLVFARQALPNAVSCHGVSINAWAERLARALPASGPCQVHVVAHYGRGTAGRNRCRLILAALSKKLRRPLTQQPEPFTSDRSLVQLLLTAPDAGWLSVAVAPQPYQLRRLLSPFPKGEVPPASDKAAPSRAFAKLVEAELRLGRGIGPGETCVDLGAAPGSWSYVALRRGASVIAVDRSALRADLMRHPRLRFIRGDAFAYRPPRPADWLLCDVIAAPQRSVKLLLDWLRHGWARRFVVTIKFKGTADFAALDQLKRDLPTLCREFFLLRLCANKNEACAFGEAVARA